MAQQSRGFPMKLGMMLVLGLAAVGDAGAGCAPRSLYAEYRVTSSLLAHHTDSSVVVQLYRDGCIAITRPPHYVRPGHFARQLDRAQFKALEFEIQASGIDRLASVDLVQRLQAKRNALPVGTPMHLVTDPDLIEFRLFVPGEVQPHALLRLSGLREDLLNLPDDPDLLALASLREAFEALIDSSGAEVSPRKCGATGVLHGEF